MLICFTDLDGTLLNHDDYRYDAAIPVIRQLQAAGVPVIPTTSKTRAEVMGLRSALGLNAPFIVENGSGIFLEPNDQRFRFTYYGEVDGFKTMQLGVSYAEARAGLKAIAQLIGEPLSGFNDMTLAELQASTNLSFKDLQLACNREFSEPFLRPQTALDQLETIARRKRFKILVGNRFCHLLGAGASKGEAVNLIKQAWCEANPDRVGDVLTLGLGDSPNDISMLDAVDIPIVVPGVNGAHPELRGRAGYQIAPAMGCQGWAAAVTKVMQEVGVPVKLAV
ncbi:HAD-IIB family hydrolase [filamentous cyanobacterium LEGE 11480]|uniref:HAD-IIB family hydrolase n=1 Tax=Romeriopsis navalis LEGE 11480 TaxID=2777977 RepID=A0A928VNR1_9CYAN|nr:HAD-IIB family hydrolase [Romeriopsis navalis]MBE9030086.1 HAD-IIB family hydrolase [Romeriopsis navalis LEGE 11480]